MLLRYRLSNTEPLSGLPLLALTLIFVFSDVSGVQTAGGIDQSEKPVSHSDGTQSSGPISLVDSEQDNLDQENISLDPLGDGVLPDFPIIELSWHRSFFGGAIAESGIAIADIDADNEIEIVAATSHRRYEDNDHWYVLSYDGNTYIHEWTSLDYEGHIDRLDVAQLDEDANLEILIVVDGHILIYDGLTRELESDIPTLAGDVNGVAIGNLDMDPAIEVVICDSDDGWVYDLGSGEAQLTLAGFGCEDVGIGETDGVAGLEIVVANDDEGYVLHGETGADLWSIDSGFGFGIAVADFDGDEIDEIAAGFGWNEDIQVWNADDQSLAWDAEVGDFATMIAADVEGDGSIELVVGERQLGDISVFNGVTGKVKWAIRNPHFETTEIAVGDVDGDAVKEIVFGNGVGSSGPDFLFVLDSVSQEIEWESPITTGPFYGFAYGDIDADNQSELIYTTFNSDFYGADSYFIHDATDKSIEYISTGFDQHGFWRIQLADVDEDPALEIFMYNSRSDLACIDGASGSTQWLQYGDVGVDYTALQIGDLDNNGDLEVVVAPTVRDTGAPGVFVRIFDASSGNPEWTSPNLESFFTFWAELSLLRIADVDDDGNGEILVSQLGGGLMILDPVTETIDLAQSGLDITALETAYLDNDDVPEIVIGTTGGEIQSINQINGVATTLAGPFGGTIDGLAIKQITGNDELDFVFAVSDRLHVVDGATAEVRWTSEDLGVEVGRNDSLKVDDFDGDGDIEIWVNVGDLGMMIFEIDKILIKSGFE